MNIGNRNKSALIVAFVVILPVLTLGQQSILLQPDEQAPLLNNAPVDNSTILENSKPIPPVTAPITGPIQAPSPLLAKISDIHLVSVSSRKSETGFVVDLKTKGGSARFEASKLQNPARLVIDLPGVRLIKNLKKQSGFELGSIRVGQHADKTRVVVDFGKRAIPDYEIVQDDQGIEIRLTVAVDKAAPSSPLSSVVAPPVAPSVSVPLPISDADVDNDFMLQPVKKQQISKALLANKPQLISIDLRDAEIRNVLRFMADASGNNIVVGDHISGRVSIQLKNVPWNDALNAILQVAGLGYTQTDGIIRVLPLDAMEKEQSSRFMNSQLAESNLPLVTQVFPVNYEIAQTLVPQIKEMLGARGRVSVNQRTNVLIISDVQSNIDQIDRLIQTLDTQTPQVLIEARMVEAKTEFSRSLGIQWGGSVFGVNGGIANPTGLAAAPSIVGSGGTIAAAHNYAVNLPAQAATSSIGVNLGTIGNMAVLNARLSAAETDRQAKTVSMPKIMTLDNKAARITQGFQIPYTVVTNNIVQTQFVQAGLQLDVVPHVTSDGAVQMSVKISQNMPDFTKKDNLGIPAILIKEATTELLVKDGDTAVIGGIYIRNMINESQKVPFLGNIPVLGWFFKNSGKSDEQSEMLVFLTPRLLNRSQSTIDTSLVESKQTNIMAQ